MQGGKSGIGENCGMHARCIDFLQDQQKREMELSRELRAGKKNEGAPVAATYSGVQVVVQEQYLRMRCWETGWKARMGERRGEAAVSSPNKLEKSYKITRTSRVKNCSKVTSKRKTNKNPLTNDCSHLAMITVGEKGSNLEEPLLYGAPRVQKILIAGNNSLCCPARNGASPEEYRALVPI